MGSTEVRRRNLWWYGRFLFACWGAGLGITIVFAVLAMPFSRTDWIGYFAQNGYPMLLAAMLVSPLIWKRLR